MEYNIVEDEVERYLNSAIIRLMSFISAWLTVHMIVCLNRCVFNLHLEKSADGASHSACGRAFHSLGAVTTNAWWPVVTSLWRGLLSKFADVLANTCEALRYTGASPF